MNEQLSLFDSLYYMAPPPGPPDAVGALLSVALIVIPWLLIGWLIWMLA